MRLILRDITLILALLCLAGGPVWAHPFDENNAISQSYFTVLKNRVNFSVSFIINPYINLRAKNYEEYDAIEARLRSEKATGEGAEIGKLKKYFLKKVFVFDAKTPLPCRVEGLKLENYKLLSLKDRLRTVRVSGFCRKTDESAIKDLYIFNQLFNQSPARHKGTAEIEVGPNVYDFIFNKNNYFRMLLDQTN